MNTYGAEIEKAIANKSDQSVHLVGDSYFARLEKAATARKTPTTMHVSDVDQKTIIGVVSKDLGEQGLDNGFNLLETAIDYQYSLPDLQKKIQLDMSTSQNALHAEGASIINFSIHPLGKRDMETYKKTVAPKTLYKYIWNRGFDHSAGIDARAQNSPGTGTTVAQSADAVSTIIGAGAAFIGIFANSPFEEGKLSPYKETRSTMWKRMMGNSLSKGDWTTAQFPKNRFRTLAQYFTWMFGENTHMHFVLSNEEKAANYKSKGNKIVLIPKNPSLLEFLSKKNWDGVYLLDVLQNSDAPSTEIITPTIQDLELLQWSQFAGARVRFNLKPDCFSPEAFVAACADQNDTKVERLFENGVSNIYIEGRDPGANFADAQIHEAGKDIADSVVISPSALQAGLLQNLKNSIKYIDSIPWETLGNLRNEAIKNGLHGESNGIKVYDFAQRIVELAHEGLSQDDQKFLAYPNWVLQTKQNGADRALKLFNKTKSINKTIALRYTIV